MNILRPQAPLVLALSLLVCKQASAKPEDLEIIRARLLDSYTAKNAPADDPDIVKAQTAIINRAQTTLDTLKADGSMPNIDYARQPDANWPLNTHFSQVLSLAQAYTIGKHGLRYQGAPLSDQGLLEHIERALTFGAKYYCGDQSCVGKGSNWWWWQIGVPRNLGATLLLLDGRIDQALFTQLVRHIRFHVRDLAHMATFTGQNLVWCAFNHLRLGLLDRDESELEAVRDAIELEVVINPGLLQESDGIKPDFSFQQHRGIIYTGGYGAFFANDIGTYLQLTDSTPFSLSQKAKLTMVDYVADGVAWEVVGGYWDVGVLGRGYSRKTPTPDAATARDALIKFSFVTSPRQAELRARAKSLIASLGIGGLDNLSLAKQVERSPEVAALPSGHRHYFSSDHTVHRRDEYYASIKMFSTRTQSGEVVNDEGKLSSRLSDGRLYLVRRGDEFFRRGLWPAMDWSRLPGITVEQTGSAANNDVGVGFSAFVGGTGDGQNGVSAMVALPRRSSLRAQKSWFFFDDTIVFLGSSIRATSSSPVETIVQQWPLSKPDAPLIADGKTIANGPFDATLEGVRWFEADGFGYYFPEGANVKAEIKDQTGNWSSLGTQSGAVTARFLTLSVPHGATPTSAKYAYAIALTGQNMAAWTASEPFTILHNDKALSAVHSKGATGVVFWAPGSVQIAPDVKLESDKASTVWITDDTNNIALHVADPAAQQGKLTLTVSGKFLEAAAGDAKISVTLSDTQAVISSDREQGRTHSARLSRRGFNEAVGGSGGEGNSAGVGGTGSAGENGHAGALSSGGTAGAAQGGTPAQAGNSDPHSTSSSDDAGCGCSIPRKNAGTAAGLLALTLVAFLRRTRHAGCTRQG